MFYENGGMYIYVKSEDMLYLENTDEAQVLFIPRNTRTSGGELAFKALSTIDREIVVDLEVVDLQLSDLYLQVAVTLPEGCPVGEYEYTVLDGEDVVSTGLLIIGEYTAPDQYEKTITYEQYATE